MHRSRGHATHVRARRQTVIWENTMMQKVRRKEAGVHGVGGYALGAFFAIV